MSLLLLLYLLSDERFLLGPVAEALLEATANEHSTSSAARRMARIVPPRKPGA